MGSPLPPETPMQRDAMAAAPARRRPSNASRALLLSVGLYGAPRAGRSFFLRPRKPKRNRRRQAPSEREVERFQTRVFEAPPMIVRPFAPSQTQHGPQTPRSGACATTSSPSRKITRQVVSR
jgi:hypothetical protein